MLPARLGRGPVGKRPSAAGAATLRGPRELCCRECRSALVRNTKAVYLRPCGACNCQLGTGGMKDASELRRLPGVDTERHHVLDLEVNRVSDAHRMAEALLVDLDRRTLHAQVLRHQGAQRRHGPTEGTGEDAAE